MSDLLVWDNGALHALLLGGQGPVARDLARRSIRVESQAKVNASGRPGPRVITGRLRGSISWRISIDSIGMYSDIGSNVSYAAYVELGTDRAPAYPYLRPALAVAGG